MNRVKETIPRLVFCFYKNKKFKWPGRQCIIAVWFLKSLAVGIVDKYLKMLFLLKLFVIIKILFLTVLLDWTFRHFIVIEKLCY